MIDNNNAVHIQIWESLTFYILCKKTKIDPETPPTDT